MLINAINENFKTNTTNSSTATRGATATSTRRTAAIRDNGHFVDFDFVNAANSNSNTNACAVQNRAPVVAPLRQMKETDCDSATPSLEQEMNLARRACWCNSGSKVSSQGTRCKNCCHAAAAINIKTTTNTNSMNAANDDDDDDDGGDAVGQAAVADDNDADADDADVESDGDVTTVLNGATFSKNIKNLILNDNKTSSCKSSNGNAKTIVDNDNAENDNDKADDYDNDNVDDDVVTKTSETITTTTTNTNVLSKSNLIRRKIKTNTTTPTANAITATSTTKTTIKTTHTPNNVTSSATETEMADQTANAATTPATTLAAATAATASAANWQALLLRLWLAFVAFCDKMTIKPDDPRFAEARRRDQEQRQRQQAQKQQEQQQPAPKEKSTPGNAGSDATSSGNQSTKPTAASQKRYKLLTSKKLLLVFLVCVFFSCINRIEARPNRSAYIENAISGDTVTDGGAGVTEKLEKLSDIVAARLESATDRNDEDPTAAPEVNTRPPIVVFDDEDDHHVERYPVAQVDFDRVKTPFIISVWILSASIAKIGFHMTPKLHLIFPESCLLIVVGVVIGVVLYFGTEVAVSPLTPNTFFFYMLPPIILDAGYFMPNRLFFDNLGTILLMAVVGTIFNIATIGFSLWGVGLTGLFGEESQTPKFLDIFLFSSLISAVDPVAVLAVFEEIHVNEILYIVVFGESLLNDAVTVVMYHMMEVYNEIGIANIIPQDIASGVGSFFVVAIGGTIIGIIWGFLTGLVTRFTDHVRVIEPIFIFVMAYLAYLNAEIFHMSGILAITFCGITMKNYVESNISQKSHTTVKYALKMLSSSSETIIFMFLGVATVNNDHVWNTWFVVLTITFCSVYRVIGVIILTAIANRFRLHKLSRVDQFVMSYGGLRGAVAFALVLLVDDRVVKQKDMFVTTTIAVIYFTVFVQGITIKPLVSILNVKRANKRKPTMNERIHERFMDHLMAGIEDIVGKTGNYNVRDKFKRFDNRFIRPLLIRDLKGAEPKIIETYSKLTMRDAMEVMRRNPSTIGQITATESMSALFRNYTNNCIGGRWAPPTIYTTCPSLTNLDNTCSRNLDMHELDYNPSKKDLTDAKIHHLLAEELKPYRRASIQMHRRLSYSRHAVDDRDLSTQVNYKMQMNFRRMFNDRKHHKRSKRGASKQPEGVKQNHVSFHDFQQNGTTKQFSHEENQPKLNELNVAGANDDWDDGLTFTAKSSLAENPIPEEDRNVSRDSDGERRVATPTATESQLPWKRHAEDISDAVQQNEFPAWASNKEYLAYNSPSATFLGGINKPKQPKSVIGLFRRESSGSKGGSSLGGGDISIDVGSDPALIVAFNSIPPGSTPVSRMDKRSQSVSAASGVGVGVGVTMGEGHAGPFPVTASHRRNVRRGSMLELSGDIIPEETYQHGHSKSLCEPAGDEWDDGALSSGTERASVSTTSEKLLRGAGSGREPLLPKLTPRAQIRRLGGGVGGVSGGSKNQVTTALLSTSNSDYDDDEDEDFDLYDDENIVVTTTTTGADASVGQPRGGSGNGGAAGGGNNTTTTIRLTRNNDESII